MNGHLHGSLAVAPAFGTGIGVLTPPRAAPTRPASQSSSTSPTGVTPRYSAGWRVTIGSTSSSDSPVKRTVFATAHVERQRRAREVRLPRHRHAARLVEPHAGAAQLVLARRLSRGRRRVGDEDHPRGRLRAHHRLHGARRQVMAVHDQRGRQRVRRELLPDHVRVPRDELRDAVAEMRRERGARLHGRLDLLGRRRGVSDRHAHPAAHQRARRAAARPTSGATVTMRMRPSAASWRRSKSSSEAARTCSRACAPARAILRRDVRPLHVEAQHARRLRTHERPRALREALERARDERRQAGRHARAAHRGHRRRAPARRSAPGR
jgi:hypothetical protein